MKLNLKYDNLEVDLTISKRELAYLVTALSAVREIIEKALPRRVKADRGTIDLDNDNEIKTDPFLNKNIFSDEA